MKHARKLTSLLLALVMVFALAVTVAADETTGTTIRGKITVVNPKRETTYTAYKIFDVVYDNATPTKHYSYTIDSAKNSDWFTTVNEYAKTTGSGLTLTQVEGTNTYVVTFNKDEFSAPKFAETLNGAVTGKTGKPLAVADGKATVTDLDLGYYFVTSASGALCNLTTTDPDAEIHDKTDVPFEKKDDKDSAEVGETVNYTIKGKVPDTTGFKTYTYKITDTMSDGLTFQKDVKVSIGGTEIPAETVETWIEYTPDAESATGFKLTIPVKGYQNQVGAGILVTYSALVNEKAVAQISKNSATLTYSNNPSTGTETSTNPVEETVYSSKIAIVKVETGNENKKLEGAEFVLYKKATTDADPDAILYYKKWDVTDTTKAVSWVDTIEKATTVKTNENGEASFEGLADGTYYLVETKAPAGYNQLTGPVEVPVNGETQLTATATVKNQAGTLLPSTGGMGTTIFYVLGFVLVVGAGVLLVTKKRMSQGEV